MKFCNMQEVLRCCFLDCEFLLVSAGTVNDTGQKTYMPLPFVLLGRGQSFMPFRISRTGPVSL